MQNCFKWKDGYENLLRSSKHCFLILYSLLFILIPSLAQPEVSTADTLLMQKLEQQARKSYGSSSDSSIFYAQSILDMCLINDHSKYHAFALNWIGICLMRKGYPDSAENYYQQTIEYALINDQGKYAQMAKLNRSINYHQQGLFEQSAMASQESLEAFQAVGDTLGMAHAQYNLGNCLFRLSRPIEALTFYQSALKIYMTKGSALNKANVYNAIGSVYDEQKKYNEAIIEFKKSVDVKVAVGGANFCASEYINIGTSYKGLNQIDSAIYYYHKAYKTALLLGDQSRVANAYLDLATVHNTLKNYDSAIYYSNLSMKISKSVEDKFLIYSNAMQLSMAFEQKKQFKHAFYYLLEYSKVRDSIENVEIEERVSTLEKKFRLAEKDRQILTNEIELNEKSTAIQRQIALIVILILAVIIITIWYINRRKRQQLHHQLTMNNERSRIAMDLHDHLGAELTVISSKLDTRVYKTEQQKEKEALTNISDQIRNAGSILRETVWSIQSETVDKNQLIDKIEYFAKSMLDDGSIKFSKKSNGPNCTLTPQQALDIYRICQEGITNAFKYAKASDIELTINSTNQKINIELSDNGIGFDTEKELSGFGLSNMSTRAKKMNGSFSISSAPHSGTTISIGLEIPNQTNKGESL